MLVLFYYLQTGFDQETGEDEADYPEEEHEYQELIPQPDPQKPIELGKLKGCIEDMRKDPRSFKSEYEVKNDLD